MTKVSGRFATLLAAAVLAAFHASSAQAQLAQVTATDEHGVELRVAYGARSSDINEALAPYLPAGGMIPPRELIASANPGRMLYVCYDAPAGERPSHSRERAFYEACEDYRRDIWFVASPRPFRIRFTPAPHLAAPSAASASVDDLETRLETMNGSVDALRLTISEQSDRISELERSLDEANHQVRPAPAPVPAASVLDGWPGLLLSIVLVLLICLLIYWLKGKWEKDADARAREDIIKNFKPLWEAAAADKARKQLRAELAVASTQIETVQAAKVRELEGKIAIQEGSIREKNAELMEKAELVRKLDELETGVKADKAEREKRRARVIELKQELAKHQPVEQFIGTMRSHIRLIKKMRNERPGLPFPFTVLIEDAQSELLRRVPKPGETLRQADRIRGELAELEGVTSFHDDAVIDTGLERLYAELLKVAEDVSAKRRLAIEAEAKLAAERDILQQETVLIGEERMAMQAEREVEAQETSRLKGELAEARRTAVELRKKLHKEEDQDMLGLIQTALTKPDAKAKYQGQVRGTRNKMSELESELDDFRVAYDKRCGELVTANQEIARLRGINAEKERENLRLRGSKAPLVVVGYEEGPRPSSIPPTHH